MFLLPAPCDCCNIQNAVTLLPFSIIAGSRAAGRNCALHYTALQSETPVITLRGDRTCHQAYICQFASRKQQVLGAATGFSSLFFFWVSYQCNIAPHWLYNAVMKYIAFERNSPKKTNDVSNVKKNQSGCFLVHLYADDRFIRTQRKAIASSASIESLIWRSDHRLLRFSHGSHQFSISLFIYACVYLFNTIIFFPLVQSGVLQVPLLVCGSSCAWNLLHL